MRFAGQRPGWLAFVVLAFAAMLCLAAPEALAQRTPFAAPDAGAAAAPPAQGEQSAYGRFMGWVRDTQHNLHRQLAGGVKRLKQEGSLLAAWALIAMGFIYGVVHAIGPGHGKAVISSYVVANERTVRRGIVLSFLASLVQAVSAIMVIAVLALALNAAGFEIRQASTTLERASYVLIALIGAWMLIAQFWPVGHAHHAHGSGEDCGHNHMPDPRALEGDWDLRKMAAIVLAVGVRPCSGALIVLVFAIAQGILWAGVAATFAMSLGTAITVSTLAALAVGSKQLALKVTGDEARWTHWIYRGTAIGGSTLVLALGVILFIGSLGPARPF